MGASTVKCECGAVVSSETVDLAQFPADQAFREHIAREVLDALDSQWVTLAERIRAEANLCSRAGQYDRLIQIADEIAPATHLP